MARLIEVQDVDALPGALTLAVGDVLWFTASGGRVQSGDVVVAIGAFQQGFVGPDGQVVTPAGPPTAMLFAARATGRAMIDVMTGDPFRGARTSTFEVIVA
jgi:hypothetical protein